VRCETAEAVKRVYDKLWDADLFDFGLSKIAVGRARGTARRKGWHPPFAWDDDEIDNPNARPRRGRDDHRFAWDLDQAALYRGVRGERLQLLLRQAGSGLAGSPACSGQHHNRSHCRRRLDLRPRRRCAHAPTR
jgi:hypothetical protein